MLLCKFLKRTVVQHLKQCGCTTHTHTLSVTRLAKAVNAKPTTAADARILSNVPVSSLLRNQGTGRSSL